MPALRSLYFTFINNMTDAFYVVFGRNMFLFHKLKEERVVYLANSSFKYREMLKKQGIQLTILNDDTNEHTNELMKF